MDTDVTGLDVDGARGSVSGVLTGDGMVATDAVVICGGAWSTPLADELGVSLPVHPLKGQIVHLALPSVDSRGWSIVQPVLGFYLVPWPDGRVACGGTMESGAGYDCRPTADGVHQLLRECLRTAPGLAQATLADVRVGLRPSSVDGRPVLGRVPGWANAFVATGHGAEGLLLGPLSAGLVARQVLGAARGRRTRGRTGPPGARALRPRPVRGHGADVTASPTRARGATAPACVTAPARA